MSAFDPKRTLGSQSARLNSLRKAWSSRRAHAATPVHHACWRYGHRMAALAAVQKGEIGRTWVGTGLGRVDYLPKNNPWMRQERSPRSRHAHRRSGATLVDQVSV